MTNMMEEGPEPIDFAEAFRRMAGRIDLNDRKEFAGAFVIVPPSGDEIELLVLNSQKSASVFWGLLKTYAEMALIELQDQEQKSGTWQMRR